VHKVIEDAAVLSNNDIAGFERLLRSAMHDELAEFALADGDPLLLLTMAHLAGRVQSGTRDIDVELGVPASALDQREVSIEVTLEAGSRSIDIRGKVDRLVHFDGRRRVIDYKTGVTVTRSRDLASAPATGEYLQLWLYSLMADADDLVPAAPAGTELALAFPLGRLTGANGTPVSSALHKTGDKRLAKVQRGLELLVEYAENEPLGIAQQGWESPCRHCEVSSACPSRHRTRDLAHNPAKFFGAAR